MPKYKLLPDEIVLPDGYPVHIDYVYIADMKFVRSPVSGTVFNLMVALCAKEIRRCDLFGHPGAKLGDELETV